MRDVLSSIGFCSSAVQAGNRDDGTRNASGRRHSDADRQIGPRGAGEACRRGRQVVGVAILHALPQLIERWADDWQFVKPFILAECLIIGIAEQRVSLPVIVVQVVLMEHLRIDVSHQHARDEARAHVIENLWCGEGVVGCLHGIVVDAGKLRLIVGPVHGVEENIVGTSRYFVKTGSIAVHDAHIGRWIWSVIRLSDDRGVGHHVADAILS